MMAFGDEARDRRVSLSSDTKLEALTTGSSLSSNLRENSRSVQVSRASKPSLPHAAGACPGSFLSCANPRNSSGSRRENDARMGTDEPGEQGGTYVPNVEDESQTLLQLCRVDGSSDLGPRQRARTGLRVQYSRVEKARFLIVSLCQTDEGYAVASQIHRVGEKLRRARHRYLQIVHCLEFRTSAPLSRAAVYTGHPWLSRQTQKNLMKRCSAKRSCSIVRAE